MTSIRRIAVFAIILRMAAISLILLKADGPLSTTFETFGPEFLFAISAIC